MISLATSFLAPSLPLWSLDYSSFHFKVCGDSNLDGRLSFSRINDRDGLKLMVNFRLRKRNFYVTMLI